MIRQVATLCTQAALLLWLTATAGARDPALRWWTLTTSHFFVHFHDGERQLAERVAQTAEEALARVADKFGHLPAGRIELVLSDEIDSANGSATALPYNQVLIYATAPEDLSQLHDTDDPLRLVLVHELAHIVHMDMTRGLPNWINLVFGRTVLPNGAQPGWFTEGLAVHTESALSSAGRIRSSLFRMQTRTAALADRFPSLDEISGLPRAWPQGTTWYLYGGFFLEHLAERFGEQALTELSHQMSGMLIPWSLNLVARRVLGQGYPQLYERWRATVVDDALGLLARLEIEGLTAWRPLTDRGQHQILPRVSPGGEQVVYFSSARDSWPRLRLIGRDGREDRSLLEVNSGAGAAFGPDGRYLVFSQAELVDQFYVFDDLYLLDLQTGQRERLTVGQRAREPDVSPDGGRVVFVRNRLGATSLAMLDLVARTSAPLTQPDDRRQVYTPRFSPEGDRVVFSRSRPDGGRDLVLLDLADGGQRTLTDDRNLNLGPVFEPAGKRVLFSSDRSGIFNLYSLELDSGELIRLTNVATGAFSPDPAPDGAGLAFVIYGPDGYDLAWLDLPVRARPAPETRSARPTPPEPAEPRAPTEALVESYRPWRSLLPRAWFPTWGQDPWGDTFGLMFGGRDSLGKLSYLAELTWGPERNQFYCDASLSTQIFYPTLSLYAGRHISRRTDQAVVNGRAWWVDREEINLYADLSFPFSSLRQFHSLFVNFDLQLIDRLTQVPRDPLDLAPILPDDSPLAWIGIGWFGSQVERYSDSISAEKGVSASVSLRYSDPAIGSGARLAEARVWFRGYLPVIPSLHHVLAFGLQAGLAIGDERRRALFSVGGLPIRDPIQDAYFGYRYSGLYLRGYEPGGLRGSVYLLGSLEYRLPLIDIQRGLWTLPFYLRQLHAGFFVDFGGASPEPSLATFADELLKVGLGAELRLDMLLAYYLPFSMRLGYGRGLMAGGIDNFYFTLGTAF